MLACFWRTSSALLRLRLEAVTWLVRVDVERNELSIVRVDAERNELSIVASCSNCISLDQIAMGSVIPFNERQCTIMNWIGFVRQG